MTHFTQRILDTLAIQHEHKNCRFSCKVCVLCNNYASEDCKNIVADLKAERDGSIIDH